MNKEEYEKALNEIDEERLEVRDKARKGFDAAKLHFNDYKIKILADLYESDKFDVLDVVMALKKSKVELEYRKDLEIQQLQEQLNICLGEKKYGL